MKIFEIILIILTTISIILIGTPIEYNCLEINYITIITGTIYIIYKILKKEKTIDNIDIIVFLLCLCSIIPYITKKSINIPETLENIARSFSLFNIYILAKGLDSKGQKNIIKTILIGSCILFLFGIDEMTTKIFKNAYEFLRIPEVTNHETRMFSTLGYANSFAIIMAVSIILATGINKKSIYSGMICLYLIGLILSYSRTVLVFFIIIYGIYILMTSKEEKMYCMLEILKNVILSLIYAKIFEKSSNENHYILIYLGIIFIFGISIILSYILKKQKLKELKNKNILIAFLILILLGINIYQIGKKFDKSLEIFKQGESNSDVKYNIYNIGQNKIYKFKFDIEAKSRINLNDNYSIEIIEENKYYDVTAIHIIKFNSYTGEKTVEFETNSKTESISLLFKSSNSKLQNGVKINSLYINDEKYSLSYMFLPTKFVQRIDNFLNEDLSLITRFIYIKDAIKIIKENPFTGVGGYGWNYTYLYYQSYKYYATESHNYLTKLIIENGILAGLLWIILIIMAIINTIKRYKNKQNISVDLAFLLLTLHSFLDFDLSFYIINLIWFSLYAIITKKEETKENKWIKYIILIVEILSVAISLQFYKINFENTQNEKKIKLLDDTCISRIKEIRKTEKNKLFYNELLLFDFQQASDEDIMYIFEMLKQEKLKLEVEDNIIKNKILDNIVKDCQNDEIKKEIANYIISQNREMVNYINNQEKNRLSETEIEKYLQSQEEIYMNAVKIRDGD